MLNRYKLSIPEDYSRPAKCGCGPSGSRIDLVPDRILFLSIKKACCIHDFEYTKGGMPKHKTRADRRFLANMFRLINKAGWYYPKVTAKGIALGYYQVVRIKGDKYFNFTKEPTNETI